MCTCRQVPTGASGDPLVLLLELVLLLVPHYWPCARIRAGTSTSTCLRSLISSPCAWTNELEPTRLNYFPGRLFCLGTRLLRTELNSIPALEPNSCAQPILETTLSLERSRSRSRSRDREPAAAQVRVQYAPPISRANYLLPVPVPCLRCTALRCSQIHGASASGASPYFKPSYWPFSSANLTAKRAGPRGGH